MKIQNATKANNNYKGNVHAQVGVSQSSILSCTTKNGFFKLLCIEVGGIEFAKDLCTKEFN